MSCDQAVFVDQATDASVFSDAVLVEIDRFGQRFQRRGAVQEAVRPMLVMVALVLAQDLPQMGLVPDEGAVQEARAGIPPIQRSAIAFMRASARCTARSGSRRRPGPRRTRR